MIRNAFWLGPILAIVGCITYFTFFSQFPITRDFPWVNLPMVAIGALLSLIALGSWRKSKQFKRFILGAGALISLAFAGLLFFYVFVMSADMPIPKAIPFASTTPNDISLQANGGRQVSMGDYPDKQLLVSFFRGYW